MTERALRTLRQLRAELADIATGLESQRLTTAALAVEDVLRELGHSPELEPAEDQVRIRVPVVVRPDGRWDAMATNEATTERAAQDQADRTVHDTHATGAVVHWVVADLPKPGPPKTTTAVGSVS